MNIRTSSNCRLVCLVIFLAVDLTLCRASDPGPVFTTLVEFAGNGATKGSEPNGLMQASDGNFYGTTAHGGSNGYGTVFKITPGGALTTLVEFTGKGDTNRGAFPKGALIQAKDGNLYGTTSGEGGTLGNGTVFKMTPAGALTTLVEFTDKTPPSLGSDPYAGVVEGKDGNFYGVTFGGGSDGAGTAFRVTPEGTLTTLVDFKIDISSSGRTGPWCGLLQASDGNFYGTTWEGGGMPDGAGTVFKMTPDGSIHTFARFHGLVSHSTGGGPQSGVIQGRDGNFYGTTPVFGLYNWGTIYRVSPKGTITVLVNFTDNGATNKGRMGEQCLLQANDSNFYGVTRMGGANGVGTLFRMTPEGILTTLVEFTNMQGANKGKSPNSALVQGSDGSFYGTTEGGGVNGDGTIYKLTLTPTMLASAPPPSAPAAEATQPDAGSKQTEHGSQTRQITYSYKGTKYIEQMSFDAKAQAALAANPVSSDEEAGEGEALIETLEKRGGVLQDVKKADGTLVPSEQQFSERTGKRTAVIYRWAGQQQDPSPGIAAAQFWDAKSGAATAIYYFKDNELQNPSPDVPASTETEDSVAKYEYYQGGKFEDPQPGHPARRCVDQRSGKCLWEGHYHNNLLEDAGANAAWREYDPATGRLTVQLYCRNGLTEDPANGEPAKQVYDGKTGALVSASRYSGGKMTHQLDATELAALAAKKNV